MNKDQGRPIADSAEPSDLGCCSKDIILFSVVAPLSALTFWIAGGTAYLFQSTRCIECPEPDFGSNFISAVLSTVLVLIIVGIAWLILRLAKLPRGLIMPIWITTLLAIIIPLNFAGASADAYYGNLLWLLVAFAFVAYLCLRCLRIHIPMRPPISRGAVSSLRRVTDVRRVKFPPRRKRAQGNIGFAMNRGPHRITDAFQAARARGETAIVPFVTAGFPERDSTEYIVKSLVYAGADVIEIGVPFSDPLAEGPVIQRSSAVALNNDIKPSDVFDQVATLRATGIETPLVLMGYYNPLLAMGLDSACQRAAAAGVDGIIAADLPAAESKPLLDACNKHNLALVPLVALTSTQAALELSCRQASGFVYCVSVLGVTGARAQISNDVQRLVKSVKSMTDLPVAVGFGVSNKQHVDEIGSYADGAVVGSALIRAIEDGDPEHAPQIAADFLTSLRR